MPSKPAQKVDMRNTGDLNIYPLGNRIIAQLPEAKNVVGGIYVPDCASHDGPRDCVVRAVGKGVKDKVLVKGVTVVIGKYSGTPVDIAGGSYLIVNVDEVMAVRE